jgi:hypothetical protein
MNYTKNKNKKQAPNNFTVLKLYVYYDWSNMGIWVIWITYECVWYDNRWRVLTMAKSVTDNQSGKAGMKPMVIDYN